MTEVSPTASPAAQLEDVRRPGVTLDAAVARRRRPGGGSSGRGGSRAGRRSRGPVGGSLLGPRLLDQLSRQPTLSMQQI